MKFKEGLTCTVGCADTDLEDSDTGDKTREPEVIRMGAFTNIGFTTVVTANDTWSPIPCFVDPEGGMDEHAPAPSTADLMPGRASQ